MNIIWLGHSSFRIEIEQAVLLIDPWLTGNPMFPMDRRAEAIQGATHILLTHGHGDHLGDAVAIATERTIPIVGIYDLTGFLAQRDGVQIIGYNKGGTVDLNGAKVTLVNACHSSTTEGAAIGSEAGFMIAGEGHTIYVSGDTDIMADMDWMGDLHKPDIGILCAGGHYTMDMQRAAYAGRWSEAARLAVDGARPVSRDALIAAFEALASGDPTRIAAAQPGVRNVATASTDPWFYGVVLAALSDWPAALDVVARTSDASLLFHPAFLSLRHDPHYLDALERQGLIRYWRETRTRPDLCAAPDPPAFCKTLR